MPNHLEDWYLDEFKQVGVDFGSEEEVRLYDEKYKQTRNLDAEADAIAKGLELKPDSLVMEIGTGTGELAIRLSERCTKIYACDISKVMLDYASEKAAARGIRNIEFMHAGFLNFEVEAGCVDAVVTQLALHHLPDFWKSVALDRICRSLKAGGRLFLLDSVLSFEAAAYRESINSVIETARTRMGEKIASEIAINIRDEYPTYDWIMKGLLERSGFNILHEQRYTSVMTSYLCVKTVEM